MAQPPAHSAAQLPQQMEELRISAPPMAPSTIHREVTQGTASIYPIKIVKGTIIYRYDVDITRVDLNKVITRGGSDDGQKSLLRKLCEAVVLSVYNRTRSFGGGDDLRYVYDGRKNLYTNRPINLERSTIEMSAAENDPFVQMFLKQSDVRVEINPSKQSQFDLSDIKKALMPDQAGTQADRSIRNFLEMLTTQPSVNSGEYDIVAAGKIFEAKRKTKFGDGMVTRAGLAKGVRIIQNDGNPTPALVADVKKCAFFEEQTLAEALASFAGPQGLQSVGEKEIARFIQLFRGVRCYLTYAPSRSVVISGYTNEMIKNLNIKQRDGNLLPLAAYYHQRYNVKVNNGNWPAIKIDTNNEAAFPWEVLRVLPNQRIPIEKMNERLSSELLRLNTVLPHERKRNLLEQLNRVISPETEKFMRLFGVTVDLKNDSVPVKVRTGPQLQFGDRTILAVGGNWGRDAGRLRYVVPSKKLDKWAVLYDEKLNPGDVQRFAQNMVRLATQKGMQVPQPQVVPLRGGLPGMDATMAQLSADKNRIVVFVDDKFQKSHGVLKLAETRYSLLTQHVTKNNAFAFDKTATQTNIMNKFNCKIFGLNYRPVIEQFAARMDLSKSILVLGFDVISAPRASPHQLYTMRTRGMTDLVSLEPSVVGFSGNYADDPHKFVGDYFFQPARRQQLDTETLKNKVAWVLQQYMKPRGESGKPPGLIVIMRDGLSEGQYPMSVHEELPAVKEGCKEFRSTYNPKIIYIISTKRHNKRFFGQDNRGVANLQPGSVIDTKVVRADCPEFYMQSHVPIKGTAKIPQYTVPVNEAGVSMDELQAFVNALCHSHQIVNLAISTPEPVYQASELAKRGSNNYAEFSHRHRDRIPRMEDGTINYGQLNNMLSYATKTLAGTRFTA